MSIFDKRAELKKYEEKLDSLDFLVEHTSDLTEKDQTFAESLINDFINKGGLSPKQWEWILILSERITGTKPLYGDFRPIQVAFQIAGEHIKKPKIRLLSPKGRYIQLNFFPETQTIKVFVDGWQGHGTRKFAGTIETGMIKPHSPDTLTEDVYLTIESLANDPVGVSKAMAAKLGCCIYCGLRLSDPVSKQHGYGEICAGHYNLPYRIDLNELFKNIPKTN